MNRAPDLRALLGAMLRWWRKTVLPHVGQPTAPAILLDRMPPLHEVTLTFNDVCASVRRLRRLVPT